MDCRSPAELWAFSVPSCAAVTGRLATAGWVAAERWVAPRSTRVPWGRGR